MSTESKKPGTFGSGLNQQAPSPDTFDGKFVTMRGDKLVMTNGNGKEFSHTLATDARLTCDGAICKAGDFKPGNRIRLSTHKDDRNVATCVESLDKQAEFATCI